MGDEGPIRTDDGGAESTPSSEHTPRHRIEDHEGLNSGLGGRLKIVQPLRLRDFSLLWAGMTVSMLGDGIYFVAIAWQVLRLSNAPTALSAVGVAWTIPQVVFLLVGGVVSDRLERRTILLASDIVRGVAIGALGLLSVSGNIELWHILLLVAVYGAGEAFFMPAFGAIVPDIVPQNLLVEANALDQFVRPVAFRLVGPAIGGLLVAFWGPGQAFLIDSASFVLSAVCLLLMRPQRRAAATSHASVLSEIAEGFSFVSSHTWLWGTLAAAAIAQLCFVGPLQVLLPLIVRENIGGGAGAYGFILAIGGVGSILASITVSQQGRPRRHLRFMYFNWSVGTFVISYYAIATEVWEAMLASLVIGATFTTGLIVWGTLMHRLVPPELLGRVSSFDWLVSTGLTPVSFALAGPVALVLGNEATLALAGVLGGVAVLAFLGLPGLRNTEISAAHLATGGVNGESDAPP
jgi:MFS family permease